MTDEALAWIQFFAAIRGIGFHPKNEPHLRRSIDEDAAEADRMLDVYRQRFPCPAPTTSSVPFGLPVTPSPKPFATFSLPTPAAWPLETSDG